MTSLRPAGCGRQALVHVPLAYHELAGSAPVWLPFLERIAQRSRNSVPELIAQLAQGDIALHIAWDPEAKRAEALAAARIFLRGGKPVAELCWCTGSGRHRWLPLLADIETYHRDHLGCVGMNAVARLGWREDLKARGYRATHIVMEKSL
jgi:hypothetical protein